MSQPKLKIKVSNGDDTRLWYNQSVDLDALNNYISSTWSIPDFIVQYKDDEGDLITIASSQDFQGAIDFAREENQKSLKIFVKPLKNLVEVSHGVATENISVDPEPEPEQPGNDESKEEKQFKTNGEMVLDFFTDESIVNALLSLLGVIVTQLIERDCDVTEQNILELIQIELTKEEWNVITSHPLFQKVGCLVLPYVAKRICAQQSLYPHFKLETIQNWVQQLIDMLLPVLKNTGAGCGVFRDIVIDMQYPAMTDTGKVIHFGVECDVCGMYPIIGDRYKCSIRPDWDCCSGCEPQQTNPLIKFKQSSRHHQNARFSGLSEILKKYVPEQEAKQQDAHDVDCPCGAKMTKVIAKHAYKRCNTVYCDGCEEQFFNEEVYHCPVQYNEHHKNGYDLCPGCAVDNNKEKEQEMKNEVLIVDPEPVAEPAPEPEPEAKPEQEPQPEIVVVDKPEPEPEPEPKEVNDIWSCPACTFINTSQVNKCDICGYDYSVMIIGKAEDSAVEPAQVEEPVPSAPPAEPEAEVEREEQPAMVIEVEQPAMDIEPEPEVIVEPVLPAFKYAVQLTQVKEIMALADDQDEIVKHLLLEHKGDIPRVVAAILQ